MIDLIFFSVFAVIAFLLQLHITSIPFVVGTLIVLFVFYQRPWVFLTAFFLGIVLDVGRLAPLGLTSLMLVTLLYLVSLYERKFEIRTYYFVFFATFFGSLLFLLLQKQVYILQSSFLTAVFSVLWYRIGLRVRTLLPSAI